MKPDSPSRTIWRGKCKRIKYLRKAPQEHWVAQKEEMLGWGFLNRGESLLCNPSFLEKNQTLTQAPSSLGTTGSAIILFSLDAIPLYSQGLGQYLGAGAVQTGISTAPPRHSALGAAALQEPPDKHLSPTGYFKLKISLPAHYWLPHFTQKTSILSPRGNFRFCPQNMNFVLDNYLDCTSMKIQWLPYLQIVHFGPKDSIRFFLHFSKIFLFPYRWPQVFPPDFSLSLVITFLLHMSILSPRDYLKF